MFCRYFLNYQPLHLFLLQLVSGTSELLLFLLITTFLLFTCSVFFRLFSILPFFFSQFLMMLRLKYGSNVCSPICRVHVCVLHTSIKSRRKKYEDYGRRRSTKKEKEFLPLLVSDQSEISFVLSINKENIGISRKCRQITKTKTFF